MGAGCSAHTLLAAATAATAHSGGAAAGGSGTPRLPLGWLVKAFSPRAHHPSPGSSLSFGPTEVLHEPPVLSWGWEGSAVQVGRAPTQEHLHGQGRARVLSPCKASPVSPNDKRNRHTSPTASTPSKRTTHGTHHHGGDPRTPGLRKTPPLSLRHLSNNLECSRGTTEDPTTLAHTPAQNGHSAAAAQPSPLQGGPLAEHTPRKQNKSTCCVKKTHSPH